VTRKTAYPKRLIEVDLPIKRISEHARREKNIRHGHISTLHIWWARRPLAACRAVICAALWPDPADRLCPQKFRDEASRLMNEFARKAATEKELAANCSHENWEKWQKLTNSGGLDSTKEAHWNVLRFVLLDFIADFSNWDNSTVPEYLETSRALTQAAHEALGGAPGTRPLVVDPFAGGGSIPLEALRVGADTFASDLNPVPVLLNKVVLEYIPKYGQRLADEVRKWGEWIRREAEKELAGFYPKDPDGATPIAYLWARTVLSEAPTKDEFPVQVPLLRSLWLSKRKNFHRALRWVRNERGEIETSIVEIERDGQNVKIRRPVLEIFSPTNATQVEAGTARGGSATCPITGFTTQAARVKEQLKRQRGGAQHARLYAAYVERSIGREFRIATQDDINAFQAAARTADRVIQLNPAAFPTEPINPIRPYKNTRGLSAVTRIGCTSFADLYNLRQALSIRLFYDVLGKIGQTNQEEEPDFKKALQTALAFAVNRGVSQNTSMSRWDASRLTIKGAFSKQALAVVWDFAEANPFSGGSADWDGAVEWVVKFIESNSGLPTPGTVVRASATEIPLPSDSAAALITDPPYFSAIPYADLSDFFYVWFRRGLADVYPELFSSELTDKTDELIVTNAQKGTNERVKDDSFFREGMAIALKSARDVVQSDGIGVVVYAEGTTAGWEAIVGAIIDSDWIVTGSWPLDTEMENRTQAQGSASLQSSVHIVCRPRENPDGSVRADEIGDWRDVLSELPTRIHEWMPRLAAEKVVGADAIFACLGPALEIFSRYARVEKGSGEHVTLKEYLEYVWAAVAKEALNMIFEGADATGFEEDARLTAMWLWTLSTGSNGDGATGDGPEDEEEEEEDSGKKPKLTGFVLEYDAARKIAQGLGAHLERLPSLVEISGDKARLIPVSERARYLFGKAEGAAPTKHKGKPKQLSLLDVMGETDGEEGGWGEKDASRLGNTVLDRIHQSLILFAAGRGEALKRFLIDDGVGQDQRFWRLSQALSALYPKGTDERRWVEGVLARKKGLGF
jgi:adenine-specific DNA methylase